MSDTTPTNPKPSEGAMRAAEKIIDILAPGDHERNVRMAADLIDSETGLPELIDAFAELLRGVEDWDTAVSAIIDTSHMPKWLGKDKARAALAKYKKGAP